MAFHANLILQKMVLNIIKLGATSFVETGTLLGGTTSFVGERCPNLPVFTSEINSTYYVNSVLVLRNYGNVKVFNESSEKVIEKLINENVLGDIPLFFLDAHWYDYWPLRDEMSIISKLKSFIVLIDDFQVPGNNEFEHSAGGGGTIGEHRTTVDTRLCNLDLFSDYLPDKCFILYPNYTKRDANPESIPHFVGHTFIISGIGRNMILELMKNTFYSWKRFKFI